MTEVKIHWEWFSFSELSTQMLYDLLRLRQQVFIVEQACSYEDIDGHDRDAIHLLGTGENSKLLACCRVLAPGVRFAEASIGRILTAPSVRGQGTGHEVVRRGVDYCEKHFPTAAIRVSAQAHLRNFYRTHGFVPRGDEHTVDGIPHICMYR